MPGPLPLITSFLLADQVFQQASPRKWCVIGIFDTIYTDAFPAIHPTLGLYLKVGNADGQYELRIEFTDNERNVVGRVDARVTASDRIGRGDIGIQVRDLALPKQGRYFVNVYFDNTQAVSDYYFDARLSEETVP